MKNLYFIALFLVFNLIVSCSDTVVVENRPDEGSDAPAISGYFKKRVLIEDYTGTWCGNCTRVAYAITQVEEQSDKAVVVAIHNGNDPYHFAGIAPLKNLIMPDSPLSLPISRLNRMNVWTFPEPTNIQEAIDLTSNNTTFGIAMNSVLSNGTINLEVQMKFVDNFSNLKLVVYLLENNLIHFQRNYTEYFGGITTIPDYVHNHVLRNSITNIVGDEISGTTNGATITKSFSIPVPANIENASNISFVAFVVGSDNKSLNARAANINENQEFEINP